MEDKDMSNTILTTETQVEEMDKELNDLINE